MASPFSRADRSKGGNQDGRLSLRAAGAFAPAVWVVAFPAALHAEAQPSASAALSRVFDDYDVFDRRADLVTAGADRDRAALSRLPFTIRPVPQEDEESATTAYYDPGSAALGVSGACVINTSHLDQRPLYKLPAPALHESEPGHHLQMALAQELTDIPRYRRNASVTAYVEG